MRFLAWILGLTGTVLCAATIPATFAVGFTDQPVTVVLGFSCGILMGLLGALIASRDPRNGIGWLMCLTSVGVGVAQLPTDYAYEALVVQRGAWPFGTPVLWFSSWAAIPLFTLLLPEILARFPDGKMRPRWRVVDWLAIAGTVSWVLSVALAAGDIGLVNQKVAAQLFPFARNALGFSIPQSILVYPNMSGLFLAVATYMAAAGAVAARFRSARGVERIQLKWFAYAGGLLAVTCVYAGVTTYWFGLMLGDALIPFETVVVVLPIAIGIAILRYRLFDIDLIINRTLVYGTLTAVLAAAYTASITLFQRLFVASTGQKSDAAYVLTAFGLVVAFSPLKDWLQKQVDRRIGKVSPAAALDDFTARVEAVTSVMDVHRIACRFLDQAVVSFDAHGATLYLESSEPVYSRGRVDGDECLEVSLRHEGRQMGKLVLAERRGHVAYVDHDREALQRSADSVGEALALAAHFGHYPLKGRIANGSTRSVRS